MRLFVWNSAMPKGYSIPAKGAMHANMIWKNEYDKGAVTQDKCKQQLWKNARASYSVLNRCVTCCMASPPRLVSRWRIFNATLTPITSETIESATAGFQIAAYRSN